MFVYHLSCGISFDVGCDVLWETGQQRVRPPRNVLSLKSYLYFLLWRWYCEVRILKCRFSGSAGMELTVLCKWMQGMMQAWCISVCSNGGRSADCILYTVKPQFITPFTVRGALECEERMNVMCQFWQGLMTLWYAYNYLVSGLCPLSHVQNKCTRIWEVNLSCHQVKACGGTYWFWSDRRWYYNSLDQWLIIAHVLCLPTVSTIDRNVSSFWNTFVLMNTRWWTSLETK